MQSVLGCHLHIVSSVNFVFGDEEKVMAELSLVSYCYNIDVWCNLCIGVLMCGIVLYLICLYNIAYIEYTIFFINCLPWTVEFICINIYQKNTTN